VLHVLTRLRAMRLVYYDRESLSRYLGQLTHKAKLLEGGDDNLVPALQCFHELPRVAVDLRYRALNLLELLDRILQLPVQHLSIGDDDDAVEDRLSVSGA